MPMQIQNTRAWGRLVDALGLSGSHNLLFDEVVIGVVLLDDLSDKPEPPVDATYVMVVPASIGNPQTALLLNDSSSSNIVVDSLTLSSAGNALFGWKLTTTAATNPIAGGSADKSWNNLAQTPPPPGLMFADSGVFVGDELMSIEQLTRTYNLWFPRAIIGPDEAFAITNFTANQNLRVTLWCRVLPI